MTNLKENLTQSISNHKLNLKNRLNIPLVTTYCIVILIFNWDIILYLLYSKEPILNKINFIKTDFDNRYFYRIWLPILLAILYTIIFPILQIGINYTLVLFKRINTKIERDEELQNAQHQFELQQNLSGRQSLQQLNNEIESLRINNQKLLNENENLIKNNKELLNQIAELKNEISKNEISEIEKTNSLQIEVPDTINKELKFYSDKLVESYKQLSDREKTIFVDFMNSIKSNSTVSRSMVENSTIFPEDIENALNPFIEYDFIKVHRDNYNLEVYTTTKLGKEVLNYLNNRYKFKWS